MFTGIIQTIARVVHIEGKNTLRLVLDMGQRLPGVKLGSSVAIQGVCLTVNKIAGSMYSFDVMKQTVDKTNFRFLQTGDKVNIESSLKVGDELGGHFVYGHVDEVGKVIQVFQNNNTLITIQPPKSLLKYFTPQGSITVDGVSLTIAKLTKKDFTVSLVPFTLEHTTLGDLKIGDSVNVECDMFVKILLK